MAPEVVFIIWIVCGLLGAGAMSYARFRQRKVERYATARLQQILESEHWAKIVNGAVPARVVHTGECISLHTCGVVIRWSADTDVYVVLEDGVYPDVHLRVGERFKQALRVWRPDLAPPCRVETKQRSADEIIATAEAKHEQVDCPGHKEVNHD